MPAPWIVRTLVQPMRGLIARMFAKRYRGPELAAHIAFAAELKTLDTNMHPDEVAARARMARRMQAKTKAPG